MKPILILALFGLFALNVNSQTTQNRQATDFNEVSMSVSGKLLLTQGDSYKVVLEGSESDLDKIETKVKDNNLIIKTKNFVNRIKNVTIRVTMPKIRELNVSGSGMIKAETSITADDLEFDVSGSGKIFIEQLKANSIELDISGSGNINIAGSDKVKKMEFSISGSGDVEACKLEVSDVEGDISGSGTACVWASYALDADIAGSGRISYKGNPTKVHTDTAGSGKVRKMN